MKIALIGNGKLSRKYGKNIDKCDMIIRLNKARVEGYEDYVGHNTSVLGIVNETTLSYNAALGRLDRDILQECQMIWISGQKRNEEYEKALLKIAGVTQIVNIDYEYFRQLCSMIYPGYRVEKFPSTGINVLSYIIYNFDILESVNKKLKIYGFDCFETGHYFDDEKRVNKKFHDLQVEMKILSYLKRFKNIQIFN